MFLDYFSKREDIKRLIKNNVKIGGTSDGFNELLIASDFYSNDKSIFVVLPTLFEAQKYYDSLCGIINEEDVLFFPQDELLSVEMISQSGDFLYERIETIFSLISEGKKIVITNIHGAIKYEMNINTWRDSIFKIEHDKTYDINKMMKTLVKSGYEKVFTVSKTGEFSKRGSILDIFPLGYQNPIRIDFFGDDIDTIKEFNIETQRSLDAIDNVIVIPVSELLYDDSDIDMVKRKLYSSLDNYELSQIEDDMYKNDMMNITLHKSLDSISGKYMSLFDDSKTTIFDFKENKKIYIIDPQKSIEYYERLKMDLFDYSGRIGGNSLESLDLFKSAHDVIKLGNVLIEGLRDMGGYDINIHAKDIIPYKANTKAIVQDIKDYSIKKKVILSITNETRIKNIKELLYENNVNLASIRDYDKLETHVVYLEKSKLPSFDLENSDLVILNEETIFEYDYKKRAKYKSIYKNAQKISNYDELEIGDYIVHYDYGIGVYEGIKTLDLSGIKRDVLSITYGGNTGLYIPLEQISSIMKYASKDVEGIEINTIGDGSWARAKARVRKRVHDISEKLIKLYSERTKQNGFEFPPDSEEQKQFESEFEFDLTPDQERAINDIKRDMESKKPMDRLICGDVGYGKTEVALRAAFKAIFGGKQVAVLAPTTILARQHYHTFKSRMDKYGVRVELLSRFVPKKRQDDIILDLMEGSVDLVVGTHRLLSNEVAYKDLGLLIVDEEQRFGVSHKEKIKELKVNIDCITLSATPIPRTLQMSMMGIKDLSMIETPPKNRYPIQTYVLERNDKIISDAIKREIIRGGQVFYLYNFVDTIFDEEAHIKSLVPDARICVAHGRLTKDQIENVIQKFIDKEYDVLICTTIIETGIDMPDTNTLIIHDADRLGLSQMYQIRGRVGRSNKIAYAYLMYEPRKILTPQAEKRLKTIKEFNELGSGFKIAMRDLSIRGSGDLLGEEQSGFVESVGIDMYLKILDEEINKKDEKPKELINYAPIVNRVVSTDYIPNDDVRISIHKKIDNLKSYDEIKELIGELEDRFGPVSKELYLFMLERFMRFKANEIGIIKIENRNNEIKFFMSKNESKQQDGIFLFENIRNYKNLRITSSEGRIIFIIYNINKDNMEDIFNNIIAFFESIKKHNSLTIDNNN